MCPAAGEGSSRRIRSCRILLANDQSTQASSRMIGVAVAVGGEAVDLDLGAADHEVGVDRARR